MNTDNEYLTPEERAALERAEQATPGEWYIVYEPLIAAAGECIIDEVATVWDDANRQFIAHARTDVPALAAALIEARKRLAMATNQYGQYPRLDRRNGDGYVVMLDGYEMLTPCGVYHWTTPCETFATVKDAFDALAAWEAGEKGEG